MIKATFIKSIAILIVILTPACCFGQGDKVERGDSLTLMALVKQFKANVVNGDRKALRNMSMDNIHCVPCTNHDSGPPDTYSLPIETFINSIFDASRTSKLFECIEKELPWINVLKVKGSEFDDKRLRREREVIIYEVFYMTMKPDEFQQGHEGQETALQFVKIENEFKLYGLTTVP